MKMEELAKEFILDCKVRNLAPRTVRNYEKQLAYFLRFLKETEDVETLEELKPIHIKKFIAMTADELETAMRYGSQSSHDVRRKDDLGRFGLGLKMASLSQCRRVTVLTKKDGVFSAARWDLDYIIHQKDWALQFFSEEEMKDAPGFLSLKLKESGTAVIWEQFDRLQQGAAQVQKAFDEKIELTRKHVSLGGINEIMEKAEENTELSGWNKLLIINECKSALAEL